MGFSPHQPAMRRIDGLLRHVPAHPSKISADKMYRHQYSLHQYSMPGAMPGQEEMNMKIASTISRYLLGLIFLTFGLNGFLSFIHMPPPTGVAAQFFGALFASKLYVVIF